MKNTMKTTNNNHQVPPTLIEIRLAQHASRIHNEYAMKVIALFVIVVLCAMVSHLYAQSSQGNNIIAYQDRSDIRMVSFMQDLPKAEKLPGFINTSFKEVGPLVSPDGNTLYFSRQNFPDNTGGVLDYEDIWYSTYNVITDSWSAPERMQQPLNNLGPNSINFVSVTGDTILLSNEYKKNGKMKSGMSMSILENGKWSFPVAVKSEEKLNMSDRFNMYMTYNKQVILTSQQLADSHGERDLYVTLLLPNGSDETINLGDVVNTEFDEASPFLAPDYKTLYFASKGHSGFGGFDIYVSHRLDETWQNWSEPENLGPMVNTDKDEEFFNFTFDGQYAYFSRALTDTNSDIYRVSLANLYKKSAIRQDNSLADSGLQDINMRNIDASVSGGRYANLDQ
jgi:hypothetical protein